MEADEPHPDVQSILQRDRRRRRYLPFPRLGVRGMRLLTRMQTWFRNRTQPTVGSTDEGTIPGPGGDLSVRIYRPDGEAPFPTIVFFHGGGFVVGSLDSHDLLCRHLASETECVVMAVDYRLAPEHPFPAAVEDAYAATEWAATHADTLASDGHLAVAGDSAGGALAAITCLMARDRDGPEIDYQVLGYPAIGVEADQQSVRDHAGRVLGEEDLRWFRELYFGSDVHLRNPYADPAQACELSGLPPATVVTAGFDPLRDGAVGYARRLESEGVSVRHRNYDDMIHGFLSMLSEREDVERAHEAVRDVGGDLRAAFQQSGPATH